MMKLLHLDEGDYEKLPQSGFTADYVRRETERAVAGRRWAEQDLPGYRHRHPGRRHEGAAREARDLGTKINWDDNEGELTACTRESVRTRRWPRSRAGEGVVLSRKYSEMLLENLSGAGDAVRSLQKPWYQRTVRWRRPT